MLRTTNIRVTKHVVDRYIEFVDPGASRTEARLAVRQIVDLGRRRPRPRSWMTEDAPGPGKLFAYWAGRPGVCILIVGDAAVTLVTRDRARSSRALRLSLVPAGVPTRRPKLELVEPWRWDGDLGEAA